MVAGRSCNGAGVISADLAMIAGVACTCERYGYAFSAHKRRHQQ